MEEDEEDDDDEEVDPEKKEKAKRAREYYEELFTMEKGLYHMHLREDDEIKTLAVYEA